VGKPVPAFSDHAPPARLGVRATKTLNTVQR
jgi:hypothetical protein